MTNINDIKVYLETLHPLLNADNLISERDAQIKAGKFLEAQYQIGVAMHALTSEQFKLSSLQAATYAKLLGEDQAKNVTEKKSNVEAHPDYMSVHERMEEIDSDINFLKVMLKVFENGHVFYRQHSTKKENYNG